MQIMGILNLTPDSFFEPSRYNFSILEDPYADIVDIGAVSTRPGAGPVSARREWERIEEALPRLQKCRKTLSLDTTRSETVRKFKKHFNYFIVNDISAGLEDPEMLQAVASMGLGYVAMNKIGTPKTMDSMCPASDIIDYLKRFFEEFSLRAQKAHLDDWILDPGLGFAKTPQQCREILERLDELKIFGRKILIGASEKRFTDGNTAEANILAAKNGADILRVHNPGECRKVLQKACLL